MRYALFAAALFLYIPAAASAPDTIGQLKDEKYYACKTDTECSVIRMPCGLYAAANRQFLVDAQGQADGIALKTRCAAPANPPKATAICVENRCTVSEKTD